MTQLIICYTLVIGTHLCVHILISLSATGQFISTASDEIAQLVIINLAGVNCADKIEK